MLRSRHFPLFCLPQKHLNCGAPHLIFGLVNGRQRRPDKARHVYVIESDHRNIVRNTQTRFEDRADCAKCHRIVGRENGGEAGTVKKLLHHPIPAFVAMPSVNDHGSYLAICFLQRFLEAFSTLSEVAVLDRAGEVTDYAMAELNQMSSGHISACVVVS